LGLDRASRRLKTFRKYPWELYSAMATDSSFNPSYMTLKPYDYLEDLSMVAASEILRSIKGAPEERYHHDLFEIFSTEFLDDAEANSMHTTWFEVR